MPFTDKPGANKSAVTESESEKRHKEAVEANYQAMLREREARFAKLSELAKQVPGVRVERMEVKNTMAPEPPMVPGIDLFVEDYAVDAWLKVTDGVEGIGDMDFLKKDKNVAKSDTDTAERSHDTQAPK